MEAADRFINDGAVEDTRQSRVHHLFGIEWVFKKAIDYILYDSLDPVQRMMDDAAHGVSKYQLLLRELAELAAQCNEALDTR